MVLISNGGENFAHVESYPDKIVVGTTNGVAILRRADTEWLLEKKVLVGVSVPAITRAENGFIFAATHSGGVARSRDGGDTWDWVNNGIDHLDHWAIRAGKLNGKDVICTGTLPAHVYISENEGKSWRELTALRKVPSVSQWCFPPAPHIGHIKDITFDGDKLYVGVEIGALLLSTDFGASFIELPVDPNPVECDIHRILIHPARPDRLVAVNGIVGLMISEDRGQTWEKLPMPPRGNYPDAMVVDAQDPDTFFLCVGDGWPPHWYKRGRACGKIARSRDAGRTWERLLGGLPDGQRALFSGLTIASWPGGSALYAADTDGQVFESLDKGEHWRIIADVDPVSKGEFYRGLIKDRIPLANVDALKFSDAAANRLATEAN